MRELPDRRAAGGAQGGLLLLLLVACGLGLALASGALDGLLGPAPLPAEPGDTSVLEPEDAGPDPASIAGAAVPESESTASASLAGGAQETPGPFDQNQLAIEALDRGDVDRAIELLTSAVAQEPSEAIYAGNLAEAYLRRATLSLSGNEPGAAVRDYEAALELIDEDERRGQVQRKRDRAREIAEREADFVVESTLHFTFRFDGARPEILAGVEDLKVLLEATYQEYGDLFRRRPVEDGEPRIAVVLYRSEGFSAVTGLGDWAGGVFDGTIRVPADDLRDPRRVALLTNVLRHEVAHAFAQSIGGSRVPSWLNEGLAQWLENPAGRDVALRIARGRLAASAEPLFPLTELRGSLAQWADRAKIARAYDQALTFTDFLIRQYGADLAFQMVAASKDGGADGAAAKFRETILIDLSVVLEDFESEL